MPNDLENSLVSGGISPAAAKVIANAIANVASSQLSLGRQYGDATPAQQLRLVDSDARRYVLTNLDHEARKRHGRSSKYSPRDTKHPYEDSQPATAQPTLTAQAVRGEDYVSVGAGTQDSVAQSTVGLKVNQMGGQHARLNPATKTIDSVPFLIEPGQEQFIDAQFEERPEGTVLKLRLRNLDKMFTVTTSHPDLVEGSFVPTPEGASLNITLKNIKPLTDQLSRAFWAWDR